VGDADGRGRDHSGRRGPLSTTLENWTATVLSSDQRNAGGAVDLGWSLPVQCVPGSIVELVDDGLELLRGVDGEVGLLREVLTQQRRLIWRGDQDNASLSST